MPNLCQKNLPVERLKNCLSCGHIWLSWVDNPVLCPRCKSRRWFREALTRKGKRPTFWKAIQPGQSMFYKWPGSKKERISFSKSLYYYQKKYNGLAVTVMPDGVLVRYRVPAFNI